MSRKHRNRLKRHRAMKPGCQQILNSIADLRDLATDHKLMIRCHDMRARKHHRVTLHVIFEDANGQVLHYWPSKGTIWSPVTNEKGRVADAYAALDEAARLAAERHERPSAIVVVDEQPEVAQNLVLDMVDAR